MSRRALSDLLREVPYSVVAGDPAVPVADVRSDSRLVQAGDVFVCLPGYRSEGGEKRADRHDFVDAAVAAGAIALVVERDVVVPPGVTVVRVAHAWEAIAAMACERYSHPSRALTAVGVTGTSGKTSTTYFLESVLRAAGLRPACFGTIEYRFADHAVPAHQTTPEAPELQKLLRQAVDAGCASLAMEVSSHALELRRVSGVAFDAAVFTNLTQDHLNFHPDMHHYRRAKGRLFEELGSGGKQATAVINLDDPHSDYILAVNRGRALTYGVDAEADVRAVDVQVGLGGTAYRARTPRGEVAIQLAHLGDYQVYNSLAALAAGVALGLDLEVTRAGLQAAPPIPGRFELVDCGQDFRVAVDYAHKPDALERLLHSARALRPRRVISVVGCGGDRDRGKRPLMGRIATEASDVAVITSDNPRSEQPDAIIDDIRTGIPSGTRCEVVVEPDRERAIALAIAAAETDDIVLIAGKGHETYQILGDRRIDFDDRLKAAVAIKTKLGTAV